jgi:hypothetical protein
MVRLALVVAALVVAAVIPMQAHHSAAAEYDASNLVVLTGAVAKVEWANPHVHLRLRVKDSNGAVVEWYLEMASPNGMMNQGWQLRTLQPGDVVIVEAYAAKDNPNMAKTHRVKVPGGRWLFADFGGPNGPPE